MSGIHIPGRSVLLTWEFAFRMLDMRAVRMERGPGDVVSLSEAAAPSYRTYLIWGLSWLPAAHLIDLAGLHDCRSSRW